MGYCEHLKPQGGSVRCWRARSFSSFTKSPSKTLSQTGHLDLSSNLASVLDADE